MLSHVRVLFVCVFVCFGRVHVIHPSNECAPWNGIGPNADDCVLAAGQLLHDPHAREPCTLVNLAGVPDLSISMLRSRYIVSGLSATSNDVAEKICSVINAEETEFAHPNDGAGGLCVDISHDRHLLLTLFSTGLVNADGIYPQYSMFLIAAQVEER